MNKALEGCRILVVEDEALIAMMVEDTLMDAGAVVLGPASTLESAIAAVETGEAPDIAAVDLNLRGKSAEPLVDLLHAKGIPFVLLTGYGESGIPSQHRNRPMVAKPFEPSNLVAVLARTATPSHARD
jgi:CheY-like chemotaxis protein